MAAKKKNNVLVAVFRLKGLHSILKATKIVIDFKYFTFLIYLIHKKVPLIINYFLKIYSTVKLFYGMA